MIKDSKYYVLADHRLPCLEAAFPSDHFQIKRFNNNQPYAMGGPLPDILLCRSTLKCSPEHFPYPLPSILGTASSGTDHLDIPWLTSQNVQIFDAKGSNALAVADYVERVIAWIITQTSASIRKVGIIGHGAVGQCVERMLSYHGYEIILYDPPKALIDLHFQSARLDALMDVDVLCIHASLHHSMPYPSFHMINQNFLAQLNPECFIINAARGGIVDELALLQAPHIRRYCTDVYEHEPNIRQEIVRQALLCTPHIAGHTKAAKEEAVFQLGRGIGGVLGIVSSRALSSPHEHVRPEAYHPELESLALKTAEDLTRAFLTLRESHPRNQALTTA